MKTSHITVCFACFLCIGVFAESMMAQPAKPAVANIPAQAWEHLALTQDSADLGNGLGAQITKLGADGWELVDVAPFQENGTTTKTRYYFKRPK